MSDFDRYNDFANVTKSDTVNFVGPKPATDGIYVGTVGDVVGVKPDGSLATFTGVPAGTVLRISVQRINSTSTTAGAFVALYSI